MNSIQSLSKYPRVLLVSRAEISESDTSGISRGRWLADWPKDRLAQIYSSAAPKREPFCPIRYEFGGDDRRFGRIFRIAKRSSYGEAFIQQTVNAQNLSVLARTIRAAKTKLVSGIVSSGLWEIVFWPDPSDRLLEWCRDFKPDLIYTTCTDLSYLELSLTLQRHLQAPLCLQVEDDWMAALYTRGILAPVLRPVVERKIGELLDRSTLRLSIGSAMSAAFLQRYGKQFETVFLCDNIARFDLATPSRPKGADSAFVILYSGSLYLGRWQSIVDLDQAICQGGFAGANIQVHVYTGHIPPEAASAFSSCQHLRVHPGLKDAEVPGVFKSADLLFLPESFAPQYQRYIQFSVSSKAHLYMMAGRPTLVYGPKGMALIEYARAEGWATVLDQRDVTSLAGAVTAIIQNKAVVEETLRRGRSTAEKNHEGEKVRRRFRELLSKCACISSAE